MSDELECHKLLQLEFRAFFPRLFFLVVHTLEDLHVGGVHLKFEHVLSRRLSVEPCRQGIGPLPTDAQDLNRRRRGVGLVTKTGLEPS